MKTKGTDVYFKNVVINYAQLPCNYPIPNNRSTNRQAAAHADYDNGILSLFFLMGLTCEEAICHPGTPAVAIRTIELPDGKMTVNYTLYICIPLEALSEKVPTRIGIFNSLINLPANGQSIGTITLEIKFTSNQYADNVGKVVMDANILPTTSVS
ncbi:hypothetical protein [Chitinophaga sp.]|uniref:hypothetical protein n=1 Tax=Chitinophaga sp. TaxID=1869181 RepID=UPI0031D29723